jgi:transcriptional regulator with GAF, ATPase, and Fis domain
MNQPTRSEQLFDAFATFADTLVSGYDVFDLLQKLVDHCHDLLDIDSAGILLANASSALELVASTSEEETMIEVIALAANAGPALECFRTRAVVALPDVDAEPARWTEFVTAVRSNGIHSVYSIPLRLRETTIGTLTLMRRELGDFDSYDIRAAQALADVATIGILQERAVSDATTIRDQLQSALTSRVIIEQAKGVVAETAQVSMDTAFSHIRHHARSNQLSVTAVAQQLVSGQLRLHNVNADSNI